VEHHESQSQVASTETMTAVTESGDLDETGRSDLVLLRADWITDIPEVEPFLVMSGLPTIQAQPNYWTLLRFR